MGQETGDKGGEVKSETWDEGVATSGCSPLCDQHHLTCASQSKPAKVLTAGQRRRSFLRGREGNGSPRTGREHDEIVMLPADIYEIDVILSLFSPLSL